MKLVRFGLAGKERPGLVDGDGCVRDLSAHVDDIAGEVLTRDGLERLRQIDARRLPLVGADVRLGAPVSGVGKLVGVGLNFSDHAEESGMPIPTEPILFMKATSAICGPNDNVILPPNTQMVDWEVELGVVIGDRARNVEESAALDHVAGYTIINDVSERAWQMARSGQWMKGKSADTFAPIGPWLVTADQVPDPQVLKMRLDLNGKRMQDGSSATMIFPVAKLISYISEFMTLEPGDILTTGTPPGVGFGQKPPFYLSDGDVMELSIEGLGQQRQTTVDAGK
ncbi:MAG: fumarylacetoacetate hydrolase family protein [Henriciella sp.]|nr:fumarylacetoacetate hydrolase family protein [Henriciella sp.]